MVGTDAAAAAERYALAAAIRARRTGLGIEARRVAEILGTNRTTLFRWEVGREPIPALRIKQLDRLYREFEEAAKRFDRWNGRAA